MWGGNRIHTALSTLLSEHNEIVNLSYEIYENTLDQYSKALGDGELIYLKKRKDATFYFPYSVKYLFGGLVDYVLYRKTMQLMKKEKFDAILVISSGEGWWLGFFLRKLKYNSNILICMHQTDPPLGVDLGYYEGKKSKSNFALLKNKLMIKFQKVRLRHYDLFFGQSLWTNNIMERFFSIKPIGVGGAIDADAFTPLNEDYKALSPYVAIPTAALDNEKIKIIQSLAKNGIELIAYGPIQVSGIRNEGFVSDEKLKEILGKASVTLFLFDYEGLGLIPFESLAMGTPVVTEKKLGPGMELASNPYVEFVEDHENLTELLKNYLKTQLTYETRVMIHETVKPHSYVNFARLVENSILREMSEKGKLDRCD